MPVKITNYVPLNTDGNLLKNKGDNVGQSE